MSENSFIGNIIIAFLSTFVVILIAGIGYYITSNKISIVDRDNRHKMQDLVDELNTTGQRKYDLDVQQNIILKENAQSI